ncbi:hypothetical protein SAMN04488030_0772 [Aliiroseovarius halocynthiae]|uniref:Uncharacterized protein n=1 Tax=Aliiroseovarius halocynthiae TaxID=985055 RepID=A0A545SUT5_9RHOB|nr:hypothetical protein [Aliiroseovarius halocynthiae]TQV68727.1 hypothetical protein FIL88_03855 [Aliiroseovarius halocynthiae]SMR71148.1 hypothetical protein SAMN04488030_0772 [Aliiroseovarius halocynthiae]
MTCNQEQLLEAAESAARATYDGKTHSALSLYDALRADLPSLEMAKLDEPLRRRLCTASYRPRPSLAKAILSAAKKPRQVDVKDKIADSQKVAALFIHAHDGYLREKAVQCFNPVDTAGRAALLLRCNDWVENVRFAAHVKLRELLPGWTADDLKDLVLFTVDRIDDWQRGGAVAAADLKDHREWQNALRLTLLQETSGPMARLLRKNLRTIDLDVLLPELAVDARSTFVRAVAVQTLLEGCARWHVSTEWQWVDKAYNLRRRIQKWDKRDVQVPAATVRAVLASAGRDKSAMVRKLAAEHLIREGIEAHSATYQLLVNDTSNAVRDRMDFCTRKWSGQGTVSERGQVK